MKKGKVARVKRIVAVVAVLALAAFPFAFSASAETTQRIDLAGCDVSVVYFNSSSGGSHMASYENLTANSAGNIHVFDTLTYTAAQIDIKLPVEFYFKDTSTYTFTGWSYNTPAAVKQVALYYLPVSGGSYRLLNIWTPNSTSIYLNVSSAALADVKSISYIRLVLTYSTTASRSWFAFYRYFPITETTNADKVIANQDKNKQEIINNQNKNSSDIKSNQDKNASDIKANQDKNKQEIVNNQNKNSSDIKANQDKNAADIKTNQDKNAAEIKKNQDENTEKITGNKDPDVSGAGEKADQIQGEVQDYEQKEKETIDLLEESVDSAFLKYNPFTQYNFVALSSAFMAFTACFNVVVDSLGIHFLTALSIAIVAGSFAVIVGVVINPRNSDRK